ncbi:MAG: aminodeoxychorismate synthase component I [Gammaproteobacteria bacterium]|nr:aminodeoxychorismate synthase component I [Gammaproteobacteria bacterium]
MSTNLHTSYVNLAPNARQYFSQYSQQAWAMLLDSGHSSHVDSRYDIIVRDPVATLTTTGNQTVIWYQQDQTQQHSSDDPLKLIEQVMAQMISGSQVSDLPFSGGALGYFSYDLGRQFESIDQQSARDIELPEMAIGIYRHALIFDRQTNLVTLVSRTTKQQHHEYLSQIKPSIIPETTFTLTCPWRNQIDKTTYLSNFDKIQAYLLSGDCYQINYTQRFTANYQGDEYQAYLALCRNNEMPFSAYLKLEQGAILSVSPERFIQCQSGNIQAKPIKGTRPRGHDIIEDQRLKTELINSEKDQAENLMIVDLLRNDIGRSAKPGSVNVPVLFDIESFPGVHHLVSTVTATLVDSKSPIDLLRGAFPGGSITGAPKVRAMNIIDQLEPHRRSIYCGSIGYISQDGNMDTNITIRTLLCLDKTIYCWAGGGIVADSVALDEYQECFDKVAKILPVLSAIKQE